MCVKVYNKKSVTELQRWAQALTYTALSRESLDKVARTCCLHVSSNVLSGQSDTSLPNQDL